MIRVGILGGGFMGQTHAEAYRRLPNVEIAGIGEVNEEVGSEFARRFGCRHYADPRKLVEDPDIRIIDICLPTFLHEQFVILAAAHGKAVLCEKPLTLTLESADRMLEAVEKAGTVLMVGQVIRFWPEYVEIKRLYDEGVLGELRMVYANRLSQHPAWSAWFKDVQKSGGGLFDLHLHDLDFVHHLLGAPRTVYAVGYKDENGGWNHVATSLGFGNGAKAVVEGSNVMTDAYPFTMGFRATGSLATVEFSFSAGFNLEDREHARSSLVLYRNDGTPEILEVEHRDAYLNEIEYFVECVKEGRRPERITPAESRNVLRMVHAVRDSLESGGVARV